MTENFSMVYREQSQKTAAKEIENTNIEIIFQGAADLRKFFDDLDNEYTGRFAIVQMCDEDGEKNSKIVEEGNEAALRASDYLLAENLPVKDQKFVLLQVWERNADGRYPYNALGMHEQRWNLKPVLDMDEEFRFYKDVSPQHILYKAVTEALLECN